MKPTIRRGALIVAACVLAASVGAHAATFRFADQGDVMSMDPYMLNESLLLGFFIPVRVRSLSAIG